MDKIKNIKTLLELNGGTKATEDSVISIIGAIKHLVPDFSPDNLTREELGKIIEDVLNEIIPVYDKAFNNEEILGIIEFYKTPFGKSYLTKMGKVAYECMQIGNTYGELIYEKLTELNKKDDNIT